MIQTQPFRTGHSDVRFIYEWCYDYPMESQETLFRYSLDSDSPISIVGIPLNHGAKKRIQKKCKLSYCNKKHFGRGYCQRHYTRKFIYDVPLIRRCIQCIEELPIPKKKYCQRCRIKAKKEYNHNWSKNLTKEKRKEYQTVYRRNNLEKIRAMDRIRGRKRYAGRKDYNKKYRKNNCLRLKEVSKKWYHNNIQEIMVKQKTYRKGYLKRDYVKLKNRRQDYIRRALTGNITEKQIKEIYERDGNKCIYCSSIHRLSLDHIIPVSKGGNSEKNNMVVACLSCNTSKCDRNVIDWCNIKGFNIPLIISILKIPQGNIET